MRTRCTSCLIRTWAAIKCMILKSRLQKATAMWTQASLRQMNNLCPAEMHGHCLITLM